MTEVAQDRALSPMTMIKIVDFNKDTGEITRVIHYYDPEHAAMLYPGCLYVPVETDVNDVTFYVADGQIVKRPTQETVIDGMFLRKVRKTATVFIEGVDYACDGSDVELSFSHPGTYTVIVKDWPYLNWSVEVENQA